MAKRYYIHGDLVVNMDNQFYCALCDTFELKEHFNLPDHVNRNEDKFTMSFEGLKRANPKFLKEYIRPKEAVNIFSYVLKTKPKISSFYRWLVKQKDRDDPIGHLSNDAIGDSKFPKDRKTLHTIKNYLISKRAYDESLQALGEAFYEFNSKRKNRDGLPLKLRFEIFRRDEYKCQICGATAKEENVKLEVDHKVPVAKGGTNELSNLWTLCFKCNRGKNTSEL
jgi:uncharacterized protein YozE (UPF0346 family)